MNRVHDSGRLLLPSYKVLWDGCAFCYGVPMSGHVGIEPRITGECTLVVVPRETRCSFATGKAASEKNPKPSSSSHQLVQERRKHTTVVGPSMDMTNVSRSVVTKKNTGCRFVYTARKLLAWKLCRVIMLWTSERERFRNTARRSALRCC